MRPCDSLVLRRDSHRRTGCHGRTGTDTLQWSVASASEETVTASLTQWSLVIGQDSALSLMTNDQRAKRPVRESELRSRDGESLVFRGFPLMR